MTNHEFEETYDIIQRLKTERNELLAILKDAVECRDAVKWQEAERRLIERLDAQ